MNLKSDLFSGYVIQKGALGVKSPGRGFVFTRFLRPYHRLEKDEPVRLENRKETNYIYLFYYAPQEFEVVPSFSFERSNPLIMEGITGVKILNLRIN